MARDWLLDADLSCAKRRHFAEALGITDRKLQMMLESDGLRWRELVDAERLRRFKQFNLRGNALVEMLGFADASGLSLWGRRMFGRPFSDCR